MIFNWFAFKYVPYILENDNLIRLSSECSSDDDFLQFL